MAGRRFRAQLRVAALAGMVIIGRAACAQDSRQVAERKIPTSCVQLPEQLRAVNARLAEDDESKLDTARIQSALDKCNFHVSVNGTNGFTAWGVHLMAPTIKGYGRTAYGWDRSRFVDQHYDCS